MFYRFQFRSFKNYLKHSEPFFKRRFRTLIIQFSIHKWNNGLLNSPSPPVSQLADIPHRTAAPSTHAFIQHWICLPNLVYSVDCILPTKGMVCLALSLYLVLSTLSLPLLPCQPRPGVVAPVWLPISGSNRTILQLFVFGWVCLKPNGLMFNIY